MISLFLDTCNKNIIIGLVKNNELINKKIFVNDNNLSESLLPIIKETFSEVKIDIKELERIYIAVGPGSFTGIRIGVTVAKVMAWSLKIDIIEVSSLETIASSNTSKKYICPLIDARRGYVYAGLYDNELNNIIENKYVSLEQFNEDLKKYEDILYLSYENINNSIEPDVDILKIINKHKNDKSINPHKINPIYLKRTEAEENLDRKN